MKYLPIDPLIDSKRIDRTSATSTMKQPHKSPFKNLRILSTLARQVREAMQRYFKGRTGVGVNAVARYAVLRPVATLLIASTVSLSLQPLIATAQIKETGSIPPQIAQWLPKTRAAMSVAESRAPAGNASLSGVSGRTSALIVVEDLLKRHVPTAFPQPAWMKSPPTTAGDRPKLNTKNPTSSASALANVADQIVANLDAVRIEAQETRAQFAADREQIVASSKLDDTSKATSPLLRRHADTVAEFERRAAEYERLATSLSAAHAKYRSSAPSGDSDAGLASDALAIAMNELAAFVAKYPNQRAHQFTDPNNLPFRLAKSEVRAPIEDVAELAKVIQAKTTESELTASSPTSASTKYKRLPDSERRVDRVSSNPAKLESLKVAATKTSNASVAVAAGIIPPALLDLAENEDVQITQAIKDKAAELKYSPLQIYSWVRNTIEYLPTYGSIQGSDMTLLTKRGNAFDTASLTIALLRASGIPAKYVYGTVEIPSEQLQNWVGNLKTPEAAQSLLSQGGIPNVGIVSGGKIAAFRMEHVWVEAFVNYYPSRGATHVGDPAATIADGNVTKGTTGDTWVPFDPSFKQYLYGNRVDLAPAGGNVDANALIDQMLVGASVDVQSGKYSNLNAAAISDTLTAASERIHQFVQRNFPNTSVESALVAKEIVGTTNFFFPSSESYVVKSTSRMPVLPNSVRMSVELSFYASELDANVDSPAAHFTISLPKLGTRRLGATYKPTSQLDSDTLALAVQNPAVNELPAYLIHVTPSIQIDGIDVAVGTSAPLATDQRWRMTLLTEWKESSSLRDFSVTAGSELVFGVNGGVVAESQIANRMSSTPTNSAAENLHLNALHYWFEHYLFSKLAAIQRGVSYQPISAFGLFSAPVETTSSLFGISRNAAYRGRSLDIPHLLSAVSADTARQRFGFGRLLGGQASLLEGAVSEQLFGRQYGQGVSAVRLLNDANAQGIPIFAISSLNASAAMPQLQIGARAYADIENALANGKSIFVSQRTPEHFKYTGIGYVIEDPTDGAGAYLIDGGLNGGAMPDCACERVKVPVAQLVYGIIMTIIILAILAGLTGLTGGLDTPAKAAELAALMAMFGLTALFFPVNAQASNATPPACCFTPGGDCDKPDLFRGGSASEPQLWKVRLNRGPGFDDDVGYVPNGIEVPSPTTCRTATPEILALQVIADGRGISLDENPRPVPWRLPIDQYPSASLCLIKDGRTHWSLGPKFPMSYGELCDLLDAERFKFVRF